MDIELTIVEVLMTHVIEVEAGAELLAPSAHVRAYLDRCRARPPASRTRRLLRARRSRVIVVSGHVGEIRNPRQRLGFRSAVRVPGLAAATCGTDMHRNAVLGGAAESRHRRGVIRIIDTPTMTRRPAEPRPANTESMEDRTRRLELRGFIVDPTSAHFDWASAECPKGVRLDRLVSAMVTELTRHHPVALGIMMPTWIPVTHKAAAAYAARNLHRDSLLDLHTVFMELRAQIDQLRVFVHWRTFITASGPKLYLWEAFRSEQPAERDLSILLADSMRPSPPRNPARPSQPTTCFRSSGRYFSGPH